MTRLAGTLAPLRQVLARGRLRDAVTGRALEARELTLTWRREGDAAAPLVLPTALTRHDGGWFALHLDPGVGMPRLSGPGGVVLTARVVVSGRDPVEVSRVVPAADLEVVPTSVLVGGTTLTVRRVRGAPVDLGAAVPPRPVGLRGIVLRGHDPAAPVAGARVAVAGGPTVHAGRDGRFAVAALPVADRLDVTVSHGAAAVTVPFPPDHTRPVNHLTVSLPG